MSVSEERQTIAVIERVARSAGSYGSYFPSGSVLTSDDINLASARLSAAARMNGERVAVSVSQSGQESEVTANGVPVEDAKMKGASLIYSSLGQRYSGSDVLTAYGWMNLGNGQQIDGSVAHAFSDWREDSEDGAFNNITAGYRKATEYGLTSVQLMAAKYKTGGVSAPLDINGSIVRLNVEHDYLFSPALTGLARLSFVKNDQEIGIMGWEDSEKYASLLVGGKYSGAKNGISYNVDIGAEIGLGGKREYNFAPLMGLFDPNFTVLTANGLASYAFENGWSVMGKAGGQHGSEGTPSAAQFYIGGVDRGRSYDTGFAAMPSGFYSSVVVNAPAWRGVQPYFGADFAEGYPIIGDARKAQSAFVGFTYQPTKTSSIDASYAQTFGENADPTSDKGRFNLMLSFSF